jgi:cell wall-associated NlpC family hydrolase
MGSQSDFFSTYAQYAQQASQQTGWFVSLILAQWAKETGYGQTLTGSNDDWNLAGISYSGLSSFPSLAKGLSAYIQVAQQQNFNSVRAAVSGGTYAQAKALGATNWAAEHYDYPDWVNAGSPQDPAAWTPPNPGIDLINIINNYNLTKYDTGVPIVGASTPPQTAVFPNLPQGQTIQQPPQGYDSWVATNQFYINGTTLDIALGNSLVTCQMDLSIDKASTVTLTIADPQGIILASGIFSQKSVVTLGSGSAAFELVSVEKQGTVLTVTFESWVVAALRTADGPFTIAPGTMTRTEFAILLIQQIAGAGINTPPESYLYSLNEGYARNNQETLSRGTTDNPLEDSWTCLQRLATEVGFVCFECLGIVYFGDYGWLATQPATMTPVEGQNGIDEINGTYDTGLPDGQLSITATAGNWVANIGDCIAIENMGPFDGNWIVSELERDDIEEPDITITCMQPQPSLPEPKTGGATAAVGAGDATNYASQQSTGGSAAAQAALAFCQKQVGHPYSSDPPDYGVGPAAYDCSGLVQTAYLSAGVQIPRTSEAQWDSSMAKVPPGIENLRPGDLVFFEGGGDYAPPGHVAIVNNTTLGTNDVVVVNAYDTAQGVIYSHFGYVQPGGQTAFAGQYFGALRPSP